MRFALCFVVLLMLSSCHHHNLHTISNRSAFGWGLVGGFAAELLVAGCTAGYKALKEREARREAMEAGTAQPAKETRDVAFQPPP